jgi:ATP-dependent helicase Lhr and Lhr-like helicase
LPHITVIASSLRRKSALPIELCCYRAREAHEGLRKQGNERVNDFPFHPATRAWFESVFVAPTQAQQAAWSALARGESTLLIAPTGSGKTLAAFLHAIDQLLFNESAPKVLYVSPLKALAVDIEKNLRAPLTGISLAARAMGATPRALTVGVRTGDTPAKERARIAKHGADILITTPESLYLMLTSNSARALEHVGIVILDEIHALVPTKRGSHLAVTLERLEELVGRARGTSGKPLLRVGLSATQRPLDEVARFLGGFALVDGTLAPRAVTLADGRWDKRINILVDVPVEDMTAIARQPGDESARGVASSMWAAIHPKLLEYVRAHHTTLIFVNNRRLAERLASALNDLAEEVVAHAHHGSIAREQRALIEDALKRGRIRALVATSSLELGIDMGAVDLVIQVEAPPSIASGIQRIGRAGHQVNAPSNGVVFPKFRQDLLACAAMVSAVHEGQVESTRYPRNALDVACQQIVAIVATSTNDTPVDALYTLLRGAAPFAELSRQVFENCLDLLSGRYPSDDFADLRPRLTYDRIGGLLRARPGAKRVAILNGGTIPDRGLYGVFLIGAGKGQGRVGELDEEMVFEIKAGDCFMLGASTWRVEEITFDRVIVSPAPGQPGRMPFWRGENQARPLEFGERIGRLARTLLELNPTGAAALLTSKHGLGNHAATNLIRYVQEQREASVVPDDKTLVIEASRDELGDWRICVLSPLGGQILAPWSIAIVALAEELFHVAVETIWSNDGFVIRAPENADLGDFSWIAIAEEDVERLLYGQLAKTSMFAARFRESASRALLLTRKWPGQRTPLWQQRKKATDLLASASRFPSFPIVLETYRELVRDVFDLDALKSILRGIQTGSFALKVTEPTVPSPFAASILFGYAANYLYEGDGVPAERRAQALAIDLSQLRDILGDLDLRELLDSDSIAEVERALQGLEDDAKADQPERLFDLLLRLGDLREDELEARVLGTHAALSEILVVQRRAVWMRIRSEERLVPMEYVARYCEALGLPLPRGVVGAELGKSEDSVADLLLRFARTHAPFLAPAVQQRYGFDAREKLAALVVDGRLIAGTFTPGCEGTEYVAPPVLERIRRRALTRLRGAIEPAPKEHYARALTHWQGLTNKRRGLDAILDAVEQLQGHPLPASLLETEILPARIENYAPGDLDTLVTSGEVVWVGVSALGAHDGLVALYLADALQTLRAPTALGSMDLSTVEQRILETLTARGALFTAELAAALAPIFGPELDDAVWSLVFKGLITNDSVRPLRMYLQNTRGTSLGRPNPRRSAGKRSVTPTFRSRRAVRNLSEGRWSLLPSRNVDTTRYAHAKAESLLARYGLITRDVADVERLPGGFSTIYDIYKQMEERGKVRRGYFVAEVPAMQFAHNAAVELLRSMKAPSSGGRAPTKAPSSSASVDGELLWLSSIDPGNAWGSLLPWPKRTPLEVRPMRAVGSHVALHKGELLAWLSRNGKQLLTFLPEDEPEWRRQAALLTSLLLQNASARMLRGESELLESIDGLPLVGHALLPLLLDNGFEQTMHGLRLRAHPKPRGRSVERTWQGPQTAPTLPQDPRDASEMQGSETLNREQTPTIGDDALEKEIERELREAGLRPSS